MTLHDKKVLYVALGSRRIPAAEQYTAQLVTDGASVLLIVADLPQWAGVSIPPGVTVHRVNSANLRATLQAARRFVLGERGPLRDVDLLIAGDPEAMPVAWAAARRRPDLAIHLEPSANPERTTAPADLAVITPWYPSPNDALAGAFVKAATSAVSQHFERISTLHTENWGFSLRAMSGKLVAVTTDRQVARSGSAVVLDRPEGELTRVAVPIAAGTDYATRADAHVERLRAALPTGRVEAPLIHAHTGLYGGVIASRLARDDARIIVTEHSTYLPKIFAERKARDLYGEMLERVDLLLCVSRNLHDFLTAEFPHQTEKFRIIPNAIDFDDFAVRPEPPRNLLRWLYVGRMMEHKGVLTLVDGFARIATEEPRATLTLIGSGPMEGAIRGRISELGMADRIELHPAVPPEDVVGLMHRHDLLVHASRLETFGMTVVEAVASGMPVLVARSQGPEETLAGLEGKAGLLIDVSDDPEVIAEGYRGLRTRLDTLDLAAARADLRERYGREAVAAQLREVYTPCRRESSELAGSEVAAPIAVAAEEPPTAADPETDRVVVIAVDPPHVQRTGEYLRHVVARGLGVDLITTKDAVWRRAMLDPSVRIHALRPAEDRRLTQRLERLLVFRGPGKALAVARGVVRRWNRPWPETAVFTLQQGHRRASRAFHNKGYQRGYQLVRPRVLWRIARREVVPQLDLPRTRRVVVSGVNGVAIAWHLAREYPNLTVTTSMAPFPEEPSSAPVKG